MHRPIALPNPGHAKESPGRKHDVQSPIITRGKVLDLEPRSVSLLPSHLRAICDQFHLHKHPFEQIKCLFCRKLYMLIANIFKFLHERAGVHNAM